MTGETLRGIACNAIGMDERDFERIARTMRVGIAPMTCGGGVIGGFADATEQIVRHLGVQAFSSGNSDVAGIAECIEEGANILMVADDDRFVAVDLHRRSMVDNAQATAIGYVSGLELMAGSLRGVNVLVIGCGRVGGSAAESLLKRGALVSVYDVDLHCCCALAEKVKTTCEEDLAIEKTLDVSRYDYIFDAAPAPNLIDESQITERTCIAAPGVPHGVTSGAVKKAVKGFLHDPLQIGVATMVAETARRIGENPSH
jgi:pyrrolysine biosynthesis protein PylD